MTKSKTTKRALLSSAFALLLCFTMLLGTTFAWFTDSSTTGCNVIQAGTLDIVLEYWNGTEWVDAEGVTLEFKKASTSAGTEVLWEPGCTYELPKIRVRNEGNLTAYVVLKVNGITGDEKLMEAIELTTKVTNIPETLLSGSQANLYNSFVDAEISPIYGTPDGTVIFDWSLAGKGNVTSNSGHTDTSAEFTISGHMDEEAGNEYQSLKIEGISITALATQQVYEYDSFGREYDENASDILPYVVCTYDELKAAAKKGQTIILGSDITMSNGLALADGTVLNLNSYTLTDSSSGGRTLGIQNGVTVTVNGNDGSIEKDTEVGSVYAMPFYVSGTADLTVNGGNYIMGSAADKDYNILVQNGSTMTINDGVFTNTGNNGGNYLINAIWGSTVIINGGYFESIGAEAPDLLDIEYHDTRISTITIYGGTFVNYNPAQDNEGDRVVVAEGYKVVAETQDNGDIWYTVVAE